MADVFLSYAGEDRARIGPLARALAAAGYTVWWDRDIPGGADFSQEIEREIEAAKAVIACWSKTSCASKWVRDEAGYARDKGKLVPIAVEAVEPPLGFRQNQTLDFSAWRGDAAAPAFTALDAAIRRTCGLAQAAAPSAPPPQPAPPAGLKRPLAIAAGAGAALVIALAAFAIFRADRPPAAQNPAEAAPYNPALVALEKSTSPEERAAYDSFVGGDQRQALAILERLAADLERKGEKTEAAEAYTRVGALALLVDQPRGLAARRKAFDLAPNSFPAFAYLFFDTFLMKGPDPAEAFAQETIARTDVDQRLRAFANAHPALIAADARLDVKLADDYIARTRAIDPKDPVLESMALWAASIVDWRRDDLARARADIKEFERLKDAWARLDIPMPTDVGEVRIRFSEGDWAGSFQTAVASLNERRKAGAFLPSPLIWSACLSGIYAGKVEDAAP